VIVDGELELEERPVPEPAAECVLVHVHGAGLNRADLIQRAGRYPAPAGAPADIPGLEFAGEVVARGPGVRSLEAGARVFGVTAGGAQAEYLVVHESHCAVVPAGLDLVVMGGVPEAFITAHDAMVTQAHLGVDDWMLVHAVGSGVGTAALQLGKALGARVAGTARTPAKLERCRELGLDAGIVPEVTDGALDIDALAWSVVEATGGGADVTLDLVGGAYFAADVAAAATKGRIVLIGMMAGTDATVNLAAVLAKRLQIFGTMLRVRDVQEKSAATAAFARDVVPLLADGRIAPVVEAVMPLQRAAAAYDLVASDATVGKVILDCRS